MQYCTLNKLSRFVWLTDRIWALPYLAGITNTGDALRAAIPVMEEGNRPDVQNIVILLSDGRTNVDEETVQEAAQDIKDLGMTIFSVGECTHSVIYRRAHWASTCMDNFIYHKSTINQEKYNFESSAEIT